MRKKDIIELIITAVMVFMLIIAVGSAIKSVKRAKKRPPLHAAPAAATAAPLTLSPELSFESESTTAGQKTEGVAITRDPFSDVPIVPENGEPGISLTGIIWDNKSPMAIINGRIVKVGDEVGGKKIIAIKQDRVILNDGVRDTEFNLGEW